MAARYILRAAPMFTSNCPITWPKKTQGYMPKYIVEVNEQYSLAAIHARESLSHLVGPIESLRGVVLVTQPAYNSLEVYLDAEQYRHLEARQALKAQLRQLLATEPEWVG